MIDNYKIDLLVTNDSNLIKAIYAQEALFDQVRADYKGSIEDWSPDVSPRDYHLIIMVNDMVCGIAKFYRLSYLLYDSHIAIYRSFLDKFKDLGYNAGIKLIEHMRDKYPKCSLMAFLPSSKSYLDKWLLGIGFKEIHLLRGCINGTEDIKLYINEV